MVQDTHRTELIFMFENFPFFGTICNTQCLLRKVTFLFKKQTLERSQKFCNFAFEVYWITHVGGITKIHGIGSSENF